MSSPILSLAYRVLTQQKYIRAHCIESEAKQKRKQQQQQQQEHKMARLSGDFALALNLQAIPFFDHQPFFFAFRSQWLCSLLLRSWTFWVFVSSLTQGDILNAWNIFPTRLTTDETRCTNILQHKHDSKQFLDETNCWSFACFFENPFSFSFPHGGAGRDLPIYERGRHLAELNPTCQGLLFLVK